MAGGIAGCGTPQINRIDQNRAAYETWPVETKQAVLDGKVEVGMTPEMVRVSWGQPSEVISRSTGPGEEEIWIYRKGGGEDMGSPVGYPSGAYPSGGVYPGGGIYPGGGGVYPGGGGVYPGGGGVYGGNSVGIGVATGRGLGTVVVPTIGVGIGGGMGGLGGGPVMTRQTPVEEREVVFRNGIVYRADSP
ncbi:MAG: hypothetical protein RIQ93_1225 [Verrucomicrobiota bacterium]